MIDLTLNDLLNYDPETRYRYLSRMKSDCEYYLSGSKDRNHLWSKDEATQIRYMKALLNSFPEDEKPKWLSYEEILEFEKGFKKVLQDPEHADILRVGNGRWIYTPYYTPVDEMKWDDIDLEAENRTRYFNREGEVYVVLNDWCDERDSNASDHFCIGRNKNDENDYRVIITSTTHEYLGFVYDKEPTKTEVSMDFNNYLIEQEEIEEEMEEYMTSHPQAKGLPEGWIWEKWTDGTGRLNSPDGERYFQYDLMCSEYKKTPSHNWEKGLILDGPDGKGGWHYYKGGFEDLEKIAVEWIKENVLTKENELAEEARAEVGVEYEHNR